MLLISSPVFAQNVIVDDFPEKIERVAIGRIGSLEVLLDYFGWIHADESFSFGASNVEGIIGRKERVIWEKKGSVIWRNTQFVCVHLKGQSAPARYKLCGGSALVGYAEEKVSRPAHLVAFFGCHYKPRAFGIKDSLSVKRSGIRGLLGSSGLTPNQIEADESANNSHDSCPHISSIEHIERIGLCLLFFALTMWLFFVKATRTSNGWHVLGIFLLGFICFLFTIEFADSASAFGCAGWRSIWTNALCAYSYRYCRNADQNQSHGGHTVPQKYPLTTDNYWGTVMCIGRTQMANVLPRAKQVAVISALAEGSGIRQIERMTGINRNTIMNLGVRVGKGCASLLDAKMRELPCQRLQFDELWGFIGKKERHVRPDDNPQMGDVWTFCAIDPDTKLVPSFKVGKRTVETTNAFVSDVASRLSNRVQLSTDAMISYVNAVEQAFGAGVDYAQIVKVYEDQSSDAEVIRVDKTAYAGRPDMSLATTSHVERLNGTTRLHMRRLTRLTYAFSKKFENFEAAVALHFAYYNFVKRHNRLRMTPAMAAGIERDFWTVADLVEAAA
jgi:IS1 family transposase